MAMNSVLFESLYPEGLFAISLPPTIVLDQHWKTLTAAEKALLEKILGAIKQSLNSVTIAFRNKRQLFDVSDELISMQRKCNTVMLEHVIRNK